jgi:hypothetical protein
MAGAGYFGFHERTAADRVLVSIGLPTVRSVGASDEFDFRPTAEADLRSFPGSAGTPRGACRWPAGQLGGRAFDVLMALIEARGAVVSKGAPMARVWPADHPGK